MNTKQRDEAEHLAFETERDLIWGAIEAYVPDVEARAAELEARGWSHDEAMECAAFEVLPVELREAV